MIVDLPKLSELPRQKASDVKNSWREVVREVRESGTVAITSHSSVEVVVLDPKLYDQLVANAEAHKARERAVLDQLSAQFKDRLAALQAPDAARKADAVFAGRGKLTSRPKAGSTF